MCVRVMFAWSRNQIEIDRSGLQFVEVICETDTDWKWWNKTYCFIIQCILLYTHILHPTYMIKMIPFNRFNIIHRVSCMHITIRISDIVHVYSCNTQRCWISLLKSMTSSKIHWMLLHLFTLMTLTKIHWFFWFGKSTGVVFPHFVVFASLSLLLWGFGILIGD